MKSTKPSAAQRTVDMFSGKTQAEEIQAAREDIAEPHREFEPIEVSAERWRATAHYTQMLVSKNWGCPDTSSDGFGRKGTYRYTRNGEWFSLEQFRNGPDGKAYGWKLFMFPNEDLEEVARLLVAAWREEKANG